MNFAKVRALSPAALAAIGLTLTLAVAGLHWEGRSWWCACGRAVPVIFDGWSEHTSQHLLDPYSLTHLLHGFIFWWILSILWRGRSESERGERAESESTGARNAGGTPWRLAAGTAVEAAWELFENSAFVIDRYRTETAALGYTGDTIANSLGDVASCFAGMLVARRLGFRRSALLFVAVEVVLLVWIRDSLLLDTLMLLHPIEAVKRWQLGG